MRKGEWALVTGASSGMGEAFAEQLAQRGMNLFLVALEADRLSELSKAWEDQYKIKILWRNLDLSDPVSVRTICTEVEGENLDVSVLINSAGFGYFGEFLSMAVDLIDRMVKVNVIALVQLCHFFLLRMKARRDGVIINIASIAGQLPYPFAAVYSASKSFVHFFTNVVWAENREKNIKIVSLCPGYTKTRFEAVSKEPSSIHLFPGEDPRNISKKTLSRLSRNQ